MNRNATLVLALMALLAGALGYLLFAPPVEGGEVLGMGQTEETAGPGRSDAELDLGSSGGGEESERVEIVVPGPITTDPSLVRPATDLTTLTGRVVDADGRPLTGAEIELWGSASRLEPAELGIELVVFAPGAERPTLDHPRVTSHRTARTDGEGRFTFEELPALSTFLNLEARHGQLAPLRVFALEPRPGRARDLGDLVLVAPGTLAGTVTTAEGLPVRNAEVYLGGESFTAGRQDQPVRPITTTDGRGAFQVAGLEPGVYAFGAVAQGFAMGFSRDVRLEPGEMAEDDIEIQLVPGFPAVIELVDADDQSAIVGAEVELEPNQGGQTHRIAVTSDAFGLVRHPGVAANGYLRAWVEAEGYLSTNSWVRVSEDKGGLPNGRLALRSDKTLTLTVVDDETDAPIAGARIDATQAGFGALEGPVRAGFAVPLGVPPAAITDAEGRASLPMDRDQPYLTVTAEGYAPVTETRVPRSSGNQRSANRAEDSEFEVRLKRGALLAIEVTGAGEPLAGVEVELRLAHHDPAADDPREDEGRGRNGWRNNRRDQLDFETSSLAWRTEEGLVPVRRTTTDGGGAAAFGGVPVGLYYLELRMPSGDAFGPTSYGPIQVLADTSRLDLEVELLPAGAVEGVALFRGEPAAGQRVLLIAAANAEVLEAGSDLPDRAHVLETDVAEDGSFALPAVAPGTWKAVALLPYSIADHRLPIGSPQALRYQLSQNAQLIEVVSGATTTVTLEGQSRGATLSGVARINHEPVRGARIRGSWRSPDGSRQTFSTRTDAEGRFEARGLLPGEWSVQATTRSTTEDAERQVNRSWITFHRGAVFVPDTGDAWAELSAETGAVQLVVQVVEPETKPVDSEGNELDFATPYYTRVQLRPDPEAGGVPGMSDDDAIDTWVNHKRTQLIDLLPGGHYRMSVQSNAWDEVTVKLRVVPGSETKLEVEATLKGEEPQQAINTLPFDSFGY